MRPNQARTGVVLPLRHDAFLQTRGRKTFFAGIANLVSVLWEGTGRGLFSLLLSHKFPPLSFSLKKGSKFDGQPEMTPTSRQDKFFFRVKIFLLPSSSCFSNSVLKWD